MEQSGVLCYILYRERSEDMKVTVEQITGVYTCVIRFKDGKMEETVPEKA